MPLDVFISSISAPSCSGAGHGSILTSMPGRVPHALLHSLKHNKVLHERVVLLTMTTRDIPKVAPGGDLRIDELGCSFQQFKAFFGFKEDPDVPALLDECGRRGYPFDMMDTSFLSRARRSSQRLLLVWRFGGSGYSFRCPERTKASEFFNVPTNQWSSSARRWSSKRKRPDPGALRYDRSAQQ